MGWHPWAGVGPHGAAIRAKLEKEITGDLQGWPRRRLIQEFRASLTYALMAYIAKQLRAAEDALPSPDPEPAAPPTFQGGPAFSAAELQADEEEPEVFIGPIRIRGVRPPNPLPHK